METEQKRKVEQQFAQLQVAVLEMQQALDLQAPGEPQAVRSCTSCLSNSCNQPAVLQSGPG